jgi:G3E family GTPase
MSRPPLPLTVIGGFLGAGKTTLLNHWLRHAGGQRLAVLVNDFGAIAIDAALVESRAADTIALANGCVCCQIGDDLTRALIRVLAAVPRYDAVVVEASGVADPARVAQFGRADPGLVLEGVVVLVDAGAVLAQAGDPLLADTLERQLRAADLIVVNKCDLASAAERGRVWAWAATVAGATPLFETAGARLPLPLLGGLELPRADTAAPTPRHDPATLFETWSCRPARRHTAQALRAWLQQPPAGLLRLEGLLRTDESTWSAIQFAGRQGSVQAAAAPTAEVGVVAIGLRGRLPVDELEAFFTGSGSARVGPVPTG